MAKVLGLAHQKAPDGIMHQMCKPRLAHGDEDPDGGPYWYDDPGRLQQLYSYCAADVACQRELYYWIIAKQHHYLRAWLVCAERCLCG